MRAEKLRELDKNDLDLQSREIAEQLFRLRFQIGMGQMEGLKKYRELKKDRARILSILREQALGKTAEEQV